MKTKRRPMPAAEYTALTFRLFRVCIENDHDVNYAFTAFITGDFELTQNLAEARWVYTYAPSDASYTEILFQVDGIGDAILLERT